MNQTAQIIEDSNTHTTLACNIVGITPLSAETYKVELQAPAGSTLNYKTGQYIQIELDVNGDEQKQTFPYSIANRCNSEQACLQLFIQKNGELSDKILKRLIQLLEKNEDLQVTLPMGNAFLQTDLALPHLLIAAGSGIAKIKAITENIIHQQALAQVSIYWSNKKSDDFYLLELFQNWATQYTNLNFTPILETASSNWTGRTGYLYQVIQQDFQNIQQNLKNTQTYLCGSPNMVYGTLDKLKTIGLQEDNCYSDVFEYAPRN